MVMWEVIEGLKPICSIGVKGDAIFAGGVKILEGVDGGFVVLLVGRLLVGSKKRKTWNDVQTCIGSQPVDGTNDTLVDLGAAFRVQVVGGWQRNGVDGHVRTIRSRVRDGSHFVDTKYMNRELGEYGLGKVNG